MFILFRQDPFYNGLMGLRVYFDSSGGGGGEKSARIYAKSGMAHLYKY